MDIDSTAETLSFRDQGFLVNEGLSPRNALDYFCESPFYFRFNGVNSLNEQVRRGAKASLAVALEETTHVVEWFDLVFVNEEGGKGFVDESIFVIQKFQRSYASQKIPKQVFYILSGTVYQAVNLGKFTERICAKAVSAFSEIFESGLQQKHENMDIQVYDSRWPEFVKFPIKQAVETTTIATVLKAELKKLACIFCVSAFALLSCRLVIIITKK
jgi:hypothetical protein